MKIGLSTALWTDSPLDWPFASGLKVSVRTYGDIFAPVSGNKSFKLKYFLEAARAGQTLITFGGAWSNHLIALADAAYAGGHPSVGVIRGEKPEKFSPYLKMMQYLGMELHFISRNDYRNKEDVRFLETLKQKYPDSLIIPEGGAGQKGISGASEMVNNSEPYDYIVLPTATGTTLAGIAQKLSNTGTQIIGIQVLKAVSAIRNELLRTASLDIHDYGNVRILEDFHHGGYAKTSPELDSFFKQWNESPNPPLDKIYGAKAMHALLQLAAENYFAPESKILYLHTGGLFQ